MCIEKAKSIELQPEQLSGSQASQPGLLPVGINLLPVAKHLTSWLKSYRIATQHNAKHGKRISKTESQTQTEWEQSEHGRALKSVAYFAARA